MISLVVHVIETCVWCPRLLSGCQEIQKIDFVVVTLTFDLEIQGQT